MYVKGDAMSAACVNNAFEGHWVGIVATKVSDSQFIVMARTVRAGKAIEGRAVALGYSKKKKADNKIEKGIVRSKDLDEPFEYEEQQVGGRTVVERWKQKQRREQGKEQEKDRRRNAKEPEHAAAPLAKGVECLWE